MNPKEEEEEMNRNNNLQTSKSFPDRNHPQNQEEVPFEENYLQDKFESEKEPDEENEEEEDIQCTKQTKNAPKMKKKKGRKKRKGSDSDHESDEDYDPKIDDIHKTAKEKGGKMEKEEIVISSSEPDLDDEEEETIPEIKPIIKNPKKAGHHATRATTLDEFYDSAEKKGHKHKAYIPPVFRILNFSPIEPKRKGTMNCLKRKRKRRKEEDLKKRKA